MRKISILLFTLAGSSWAMPTVDVSSHSYKCAGVQITKKSTVEQLIKNCKNARLVEREDAASGRNSDAVPGGGADITEDDSQSNEMRLDKVKFFSDDDSYMVCYFKNDMFVKCKANPPKPSVTKAPTSGVKSQPQSAESK